MPFIRGAAVRQAYEDMGMTRREFAEATRLNPRTLTNITGHASRCAYPVAVRIARALGWSVDDVLAETGKQREPVAS